MNQSQLIAKSDFPDNYRLQLGGALDSQSNRLNNQLNNTEELY
jgi:hypothetical protein